MTGLAVCLLTSHGNSLQHEQSDVKCDVVLSFNLHTLEILVLFYVQGVWRPLQADVNSQEKANENLNKLRRVM